jgi:arylsulfatase A
MDRTTLPSVAHGPDLPAPAPCGEHTPLPYQERNSTKKEPQTHAHPKIAPETAETPAESPVLTHTHQTLASFRNQTTSSFSRLPRRGFLASLLAAAQPAPAKPNFVVIFADDLGYGDLGCYGNPYAETPRLDQMARQGMRFTDFYAQPLCGPSRAALLTGCYPVRNSLMFNHIPRAVTGIHPNEVTLAEHLKSAGYATSIVGKWHLGDAPPFRPMRHGFDEWFGLPYSNDMWPFHPKTVPTPNEEPRLSAIRRRAEATGYDGRGQTYPTDWFPPLPLMDGDRVVETNPDQRTLTARYTDRAVQFLRANRRRPFFLYLAHAMPHVPLHVSPALEGRSRRGLYGDVLAELDASTGRILDTLAELGLDRNTVVVFLSDNGPWLPYGVDAGSAGPLRAGKGTAYEGGIRVPAIFRAPGRIPAGTVCREFASTLDLYATLSEFAAHPLPKGRAEDSLSLAPLLTGRSRQPVRQTFYIYDGSVSYRPETGRPVPTRILRAVRHGRWKLHLAELPDIAEAHDVLAQNAPLARKLLDDALAFDAEAARNVRPLGRLEGTPQ